MENPDNLVSDNDIQAPYIRELQRTIGACVADCPQPRSCSACLAQPEERMNRLFMLSSDLICVTNAQGVCTRANPAFHEVLGYAPEEILGMPAQSFVHPDDRTMVRALIQQAAEPGQLHKVRVRCLHRDGSLRWVSWMLAQDPDGLAAYAVGRDITQLTELQQRTEERERLYRLLADNATDMIALHDESGRFKYASPSCKLMTGRSPEELMGRSWRDVLHPDDAADLSDTGFPHLHDTASGTFTARCHSDNGDYVWLETRFTALRDETTGVVREFITVSRDISDRKRLEEELTRLAATDPLTGVNNRRAFLAQAENAFNLARRYQRPLTMAMLDIDLFKTINDSFGHDAGDHVLQTVAELCRSSLRGADIFGRLGGEEFGVLMPETPLEMGLEVAQRLRRSMENNTRAMAAPVTVSIGVATLPEGSDLPLDTLIKHADDALYHAKASGRNRVEVAPAETTTQSSR